jgi:hypothetical protein
MYRPVAITVSGITAAATPRTTTTPAATRARDLISRPLVSFTRCLSGSVNANLSG